MYPQTMLRLTALPALVLLASRTPASGQRRQTRCAPCHCRCQSHGAPAAVYIATLQFDGSKPPAPTHACCCTLAYVCMQLLHLDAL